MRTNLIFERYCVEDSSRYDAVSGTGLT